MSYGIMAYRVNAGKVISLCGSKDAALLGQIAGWTPAMFAAGEAENEAMRGEDIEDFDEGPDPAWAVRDLVMGLPLTRSGAEYGYGYEAIIRSLGEPLDNGLFYPASVEYLRDTVDPELTAAGVSLRTEDLVFGYPLVDFPTPDDFPMVGSWSATAVAASVAPLRAYSGQMREIAAIREWCEAAAAEGETIVGIYY